METIAIARHLRKHKEIRIRTHSTPRSTTHWFVCCACVSKFGYQWCCWYICVQNACVCECCAYASVFFFFVLECTCDKSDNDHGNGLDYLYLSHINMLAHVKAGTHLYTKKKYTKYNLFICACPSSRFDHVILHTKNRTSTEFIKFTISSSFSFFGARMEPGNLCQKRQ